MGCQGSFICVRCDFEFYLLPLSLNWARVKYYYFSLLVLWDGFPTRTLWVIKAGVSRGLYFCQDPNLGFGKKYQGARELALFWCHRPLVVGSISCHLAKKMVVFYTVFSLGCWLGQFNMWFSDVIFLMTVKNDLILFPYKGVL